MSCFQKNCLSKLVLFALFFSTLPACAPKRAPLPPGEIPRPSKITPEEEQYGHTVLGDLSQKYELDYNHPRRNEVDQIVAKLTKAIGAASEPWHVNVFKDATEKNAAATKGNHIFVWTGIIDATQNEDELAGVLAHEISHVLLKHTEPSSGEEFRNIMVQLGAFAVGTVASVAVGGAGARIAGQMASNATKAVGSGLLIYPYTREKEFEADIVGLYLVKKSGYDPQAIINFWRRALNDPAFSADIPFLSTHPPAADRLLKLEEEFRKLDHIPITVGKDPNPPTPTLPKPSLPPTEPNPKPSAPNAPEAPGIKTTAPLPPNDSFDVGTDAKPVL